MPAKGFLLKKAMSVSRATCHEWPANHAKTAIARLVVHQLNGPDSHHIQWGVPGTGPEWGEWKESLNDHPIYTQCITPLKTNMTIGKSLCSIGNTSSNGGFSTVILVFWGVYILWEPTFPSFVGVINGYNPYFGVWNPHYSWALGVQKYIYVHSIQSTMQMNIMYVIWNIFATCPHICCYLWTHAFIDVCTPIIVHLGDDSTSQV